MKLTLVAGMVGGGGLDLGCSGLRRHVEELMECIGMIQMIDRWI